jgi:hypothetical protein
MSKTRDLANLADLNFDSGTMVVDKVNDRVGVGNATPSATLDVDGTIKLDGNYPVGTGNVALGDAALENTTGLGNTAVGANALSTNVTGAENAAFGRKALEISTTSGNAAFGFETLKLNTSGSTLSGFGADALGSNTTGSGNTAVGYRAMRVNTTGGANVSLGSEALRSNTTASNNTAVGYQAAYTNTTGTGLVATGFQALYSNTTGNNNVAYGESAMYANSTGAANSAMGRSTLQNNTTGSNNVALGFSALNANTTASNNTAVGKSALGNNTTAAEGTALGFEALRNNTTGILNTAIGAWAGHSNTTSQRNTFIGHYAGQGTTGGYNTFVGQDSGYAITSGNRNTIIGRYNGNQHSLDIRTASNNIVLSDGDGNPQAYYEGAGEQWYFRGNLNNFWTAVFQQNSTGIQPRGIKIRYQNVTQNNTNAFFLACQDSSADRLYIYNNGNVVNVNNSYGALSDLKLKENIEDSGSQWDDIKAVQVRKYSLKADGVDAPNKIGVIAQELESSGMSGLVFESPDYDADDNDLGTVTKQVNYSVLYMKAVKALQEAMDRIETLEARVQALETN